MHLLQFHVPVELLQLWRLHTLKLCEVVLREALKLAVYVVCGEVPVMITMAVSIAAANKGVEVVCLALVQFRFVGNQLIRRRGDEGEPFHFARL